MKITVIGASPSTVGGHFVRKAIAANHQITILARKPESLDLPADAKNVTVVKGDAASAEDLGRDVQRSEK
ncbi:hypothetical protein HDU67_000654 [Dinochytrium kinnereticum]|nr:hypothetical protein HDU67_000654 [Dinochytrium kinnereticum]